MKRKRIILWLVLFLPYLGLIAVWQIHNHQISDIGNSSFIVVSKEEMTLNVFDYKGKSIAMYPIACGKNMGDKEEVGDMKTPEGIFHVCDIQNASGWSHDFGDGNGKIKGAYGPFFIRLLTPGHNGIGIHGTHNSNSVGTRSTEGCIRLRNEDLENLVKKVKVGDVVVVTPSKLDIQ
jgi:lipoprotein-anchoring transpeptidase ErfK/SrfK